MEDEAKLDLKGLLFEWRYVWRLVSLFSSSPDILAKNKNSNHVLFMNTFFFLRIRCVISTLIKHFWKIDQNNFKLSIDGHHYELASPVFSLGVFGKLWIKIALCKMYLSNVDVEHTIFRNGFS